MKISTIITKSKEGTAVIYNKKIVAVFLDEYNFLVNKKEKFLSACFLSEFSLCKTPKKYTKHMLNKWHMQTLKHTSLF